MSTDSDSINKILALAAPTIHTVGDLEYTNKTLNLIYPPSVKAVECSTLQGLVDLFINSLDEVKPDHVLVHITSPTSVELISKDSDDHGKRRVWASSTYPKDCATFSFGQWLNPENFIILAQQGFQRVKIENDDGSMAHDLDYVLKIASSISAGQTRDNIDDGITQTVTVKQSVALKAEETLRPIVNLAPYRTFSEIDQVVSRFIFRAHADAEGAELALFEADGGRWRLAAVQAIAQWLSGGKFGDSPIVQ